MPLAHPHAGGVTHPALAASAHVLPTLQQLFSSPQRFIDAAVLLKSPTSSVPFSKAEVFGALRSTSALKSWYASTDPVVSAVGAWFWIGTIVFILGELTGNLSQVDRIWTFLPVVASAHFCFYPHFATRSTPLSTSFFKSSSSSSSFGLPKGVEPRQALLFALHCVWSLRLTYNAARRGFFNPKEEDYRWPALRKMIPTWQLKLVNFFFIAYFQIALLIVMTAPQYLLLTLRSHPAAHTNPLGPADVVLTGVFLLTLVVEITADNQQQRYQRFKRDPAFRASLVSQNTHSYRATASRLAELDASIKRGFLTKGMWAWSRHPNFACEQLTWWWAYGFTIVATLPPAAVKIALKRLDKADWAAPDWWRGNFELIARYGVNWSIVAPVSLTLLFYSSTLFTEHLSASKYPAYKDYQRSVDMFWPVLTPLKSAWLLVTGKSGPVNDRVFGAGLMSGPSADGKRVRVPERSGSVKVKEN